MRVFFFFSASSASFLWLCDTYCWQKGITCCHQLELGLNKGQAASSQKRPWLDQMHSYRQQSLFKFLFLLMSDDFFFRIKGKLQVSSVCLRSFISTALKHLMIPEKGPAIDMALCQRKPREQPQRVLHPSLCRGSRRSF